MFVGSGISSIATAMKEMNPNVTNISHNLFLEILVQYGVIFFSFYVVFLFKLFRQARKSCKRSIKIMLLMALIALPIYGIIDSGYLLNHVFYVAMGSLTVFAYIRKINRYIIT